MTTRETKKKKVVESSSNKKLDELEAVQLRQTAILADLAEKMGIIASKLDQRPSMGLPWPRNQRIQLRG